MPGFVPVNFNQSGKILLLVGLAFFLAKLISYLTGWFYASNYLIYLGVGLILLSLYLILVVSKPKE